MMLLQLLVVSTTYREHPQLIAWVWFNSVVATQYKEKCRDPPLFQSEEKQIDPYGHKKSIDSYRPEETNFPWVVKKAYGLAKNFAHVHCRLNTIIQ